MDEVKCRICDCFVLVETSGSRDVGVEGFTRGVGAQIVHDGTNFYFICPHCSAKNIATVTTGRTGAPKIEVVRAFMEEE